MYTNKPDVNYCAKVCGTLPDSSINHSLLTMVLEPLHPFNGLFSRITWVSRYQKGKTSLDLNEARGDEVLGYSGISWTVCKQSVPCSRER